MVVDQASVPVAGAVLILALDDARPGGRQRQSQLLLAAALALP
jgi:hypothetical protein